MPHPQPSLRYASGGCAIRKSFGNAIGEGRKEKGGREMKTLSKSRSAGGDKYSFPENEGRNEYFPRKRGGAVRSNTSLSQC
jgi:hypothetical protein